MDKSQREIHFICTYFAVMKLKVDEWRQLQSSIVYTKYWTPLGLSTFISVTVADIRHLFALSHIRLINTKRKINDNFIGIPVDIYCANWIMNKIRIWSMLAEMNDNDNDEMKQGRFRQMDELFVYSVENVFSWHNQVHTFPIWAIFIRIWSIFIFNFCFAVIVPNWFRADGFNETIELVDKRISTVEFVRWMIPWAHMNFTTNLTDILVALHFLMTMTSTAHKTPSEQWITKAFFKMICVTGIWCSSKYQRSDVTRTHIRTHSLTHSKKFWKLRGNFCRKFETKWIIQVVFRWKIGKRSEIDWLRQTILNVSYFESLISELFVQSVPDHLSKGNKSMLSTVISSKIVDEMTIGLKDMQRHRERKNFKKEIKTHRVSPHSIWLLGKLFNFSSFASNKLFGSVSLRN